MRCEWLSSPSALFEALTVLRNRIRFGWTARGPGHLGFWLTCCLRAAIMSLPPVDLKGVIFSASSPRRMGVKRLVRIPGWVGEGSKRRKVMGSWATLQWLGAERRRKEWGKEHTGREKRSRAPSHALDIVSSNELSSAGSQVKG